MSRYEAGSKFGGDYGAMQQSNMAHTANGFNQQQAVDESQRFTDGRGGSTVGQRVPLNDNDGYKRPGSAGARKASRVGRRTK